MVIRWNHIATVVVVIALTVVHGEQPDSTLRADGSNNRFEELCPCLPADICPRHFGTRPDDTKYLGNIMKCEDDKAVRCCGASGSFVVGKSNVASEVPKEETNNIPATQSDILTRTNADDHENEIPDAESGKTLSASKESAEVLSLEETGNIANFHIKQHSETDEEAAESESVVETTANVESNKDEQSGPEVTPLKTAPKSYRMPKNLDDVMKVYPNIMSGVPKTTPKNLPETNEMKVFDQEMGMDLHLVFSQTTLKPEPTEPDTPSSTVESTSKQPHYRFAKRRRQFRPIQRASTTERVSTTESTVDDLESKQTTVRSRTRQRINLRNSRPASQESTTSTTRRPRVTLATTTTAPTAQEKEILITSEDDKSQSSRFRLFTARRLNYPRRNTTTTTTTESSIETTTNQTTLAKPLIRRRPSKVNEKSSEIRTRTRPSKMDENVIRVVDSNHENMISMVRVALMAATTENRVSEIPRSFASVDISNRVKKIEEMLVEKMVNVYAETKALRGDQSGIMSTETTAPKQTTNLIQPFRGNKKFQMTDLLNKTPVVTMSPEEFRRTMRVRRPTVKPEQQVEVDVLPTTRRPHRRPTIKHQDTLDESKTNIRGASSSENNVQRSGRRRVMIRRRYKVDPSLTTTTFAPSVQDASDTRTNSTNPTSLPTQISMNATTSIPDTITLTEKIEPNLAESEPKNNLREELTDKTHFANDDRDEEVNVTEDSSQDVIQEETKRTEDESIQNVDVGEAASSKNPSSNSDFKPSPLWSISSDEKDDFFVKEENHSYVMNMDERERAFRKNNRHSRNAFGQPVQYLNGFVPAGALQIVGPIPKSSKLGDDAIMRYNLPRDSKANFGKH